MTNFECTSIDAIPVPFERSIPVFADPCGVGNTRRFAAIQRWRSGCGRGFALCEGVSLMGHLTRKSIVLFGAITLMHAAPASAGVLPVSVNVVPDGANYRYTYGVVLTSDTVLNPGDFFTVYDFAGAIGGSMTAPAGFTVGISTLAFKAPVPDNLNPTDNPSMPDLTWTFVGSNPISCGAKRVVGALVSSYRTLLAGITDLGCRSISFSGPISNVRIVDFGSRSPR
jgi:hypothetical protein